LQLFTVDHVKVTNRYTCIAKQLAGKHDKHIENIFGNHLENQSNVDVRAITIHSMETPKIPEGLGQLFPNLLTVVVDNCGLETIDSKDVKQFTQMTYFGVPRNHLRELKGNLFEFNPKIKLLNFMENQLEHIGRGFASHIPNLEIAIFKDNACIDRNFAIHYDTRRMETTLEIVDKELLELCPPNEESRSSSEMNDSRFIGLFMASKNPETSNDKPLEYGDGDDDYDPCDDYEDMKEYQDCRDEEDYYYNEVHDQAHIQPRDMSYYKFSDNYNQNMPRAYDYPNYYRSRSMKKK
jgi:hypothetical protein